MQITINQPLSSTYVLDWGEFVCQHDGDTETETVEVLFYIGEQDCSYNRDITTCADCGEELDD